MRKVILLLLGFLILVILTCAVLVRVKNTPTGLIDLCGEDERFCL